MGEAIGSDVWPGGKTLSGRIHFTVPLNGMIRRWIPKILQSNISKNYADVGLDEYHRG